MHTTEHTRASGHPTAGDSGVGEPRFTVRTTAAGASAHRGEALQDHLGAEADVDTVPYPTTDTDPDCENQPAGLSGAATWAEAGEVIVPVVIHTPENGRARALVVLVPGAGIDFVSAYDEMRQLAILLVGAGYCVARVECRGVGESHGLRPDDDVVAVWEHDVLTATERAMSLCGLAHRPVYGIGHGLGASLLSALARRTDRFERVIAWEPRSGAAFVDRGRWLHRDGFPALAEAEKQRGEVGGVDLPGLWLTEEQATALRSLSAPETDGGRVQIHRGRSGRRPGGPVRYDVLEELLWALPRPVLAPLGGTGRGAVHHEFTGENGRRCVEMVLDGTGSDGRRPTGVLTGPVRAISTPTGTVEPEAGGEPQHPVVLFTSGGDLARDGAGLWPRLARRLAARGIVSLRADGDRAGERVPLWAEPVPDPRGERQVLAVRQQLEWLVRRFDRDVLVVATGAGAPASVDAARCMSGSVVRGLVLVAATEDGAAALVQRAVAGTRAVGGAPFADRLPRGLSRRRRRTTAPLRTLPSGDPYALARATRERLRNEVDVALGL